MSQRGAFEKDILLQIAAMELLPLTGNSLSGLAYISSQGVVDWLVAASSTDADPFLSGEVRATILYPMGSSFGHFFVYRFARPCACWALCSRSATRCSSTCSSEWMRAV